MQESESVTAGASVGVVGGGGRDVVGDLAGACVRARRVGELAHIRLGRRVVVPRRAIDELIENA